MTRRHSAIAELAAEPIGVVPIAFPPPGFEDTEVMLDERDLDMLGNKDLLESSPKKSSTESSRAVMTDEGSDLISSTTTDMDDLQSSTNNSKVMKAFRELINFYLKSNLFFNVLKGDK